MRAVVLILLLASCAPPASTPRRTEARPAQAPPWRGGTLHVTRDGQTAVVAEADQDRLWLLAVGDGLSVREVVDLEPGDEPWRIAEDDAGRVHVTLRGAGAVATVRLDDGTVEARREVCPSPRGLAWERQTRELVVACAGGDVFAVRGQRVSRVATLAPDLRDVWVASGAVFVSRFRAAEALALDGAPAIAPPGVQLPIQVAPTPAARPSYGYGGYGGYGGSRVPRTASARFEPRVAWRTVAAPDGGAWMLHQRHRETELVGSSRRFDAAGNGRIVQGGLTYLRPDDVDVGVTLGGQGVLPVDVAPSHDGAHLAVAFAAQGGVLVLTSPRVSRDSAFETLGSRDDRAVAVGWVGRHVLAQLVDPPRVALYARGDEGGHVLAVVPLGDPAPTDLGRHLFHQATESWTACASCHPEAGDDGFVWTFRRGSPRRTPALLGGLTATAPFHWDGEHATMASLLDDVFRVRMGGAALRTDEVAALERWLDRQPTPRFASHDRAAVARGRALFGSPRVACAECHSGPRLTDHLSHDVGTGGVVQTPTLLGLRARAPYLHDGRAPTLESRLGPHHTEGHGDLADLSDADEADLVAYLRSL